MVLSDLLLWFTGSLWCLLCRLTSPAVSPPAFVASGFTSLLLSLFFLPGLLLPSPSMSRFCCLHISKFVR
ncbi:hypothetical protein ACP4OV_002383 [Aristida adscensionis]